MVDALIAAVAAAGDRLARRIECRGGLPSPDHRPGAAAIALRAGGFGADNPDVSRSSPPPMSTPSAKRCSTPTIGRPTCATRCGSARPSPPPAPTTPPSSKSARTRCSPTPSMTPSVPSSTATSAPCSATPTTPCTFHTNLNATYTTHPPQTPHPAEPHPRPTHHPLAPHPPLDQPIGYGSACRGEPIPCWVSASPTRPMAHGFGKARLRPDLLWLGDHCIDDACVLPGAAYAEIALAAATDAFDVRRR